MKTLIVLFFTFFATQAHAGYCDLWVIDNTGFSVPPEVISALKDHNYNPVSWKRLGDIPTHNMLYFSVDDYYPNGPYNGYDSIKNPVEGSSARLTLYKNQINGSGNDYTIYTTSVAQSPAGRSKGTDLQAGSEVVQRFLSELTTIKKCSDENP